MKIVQITTDDRDFLRKYDRPVPSFGSAPEALLTGLECFSEVEVHVVSTTRKRLKVPSQIGKNIFFHQVKIPKWGRAKSLYSPCVCRIRSVIAGIQPDIVHGQGTEGECALAATYSGYPSVITIHGNMKYLHSIGLAGPKAFGMIASTLESHALKRAVGVICNSEHTRELVEKRAQKVWTVPNALRQEFFANLSIDRDEIYQKNDKIQILTIGVVNQMKRQVEILEMVTRLAEEGLQVEIVFVGRMNRESEYGKKFLGLIAKAEEKGFARYTGGLRITELISLMDLSLIHI